MVYCQSSSGQLSSYLNPITLKLQVSFVYIYSVPYILQLIVGYCLLSCPF